MIEKLFKKYHTTEGRKMPQVLNTLELQVSKRRQVDQHSSLQNMIIVIEALI